MTTEQAPEVLTNGAIVLQSAPLRDGGRAVLTDAHAVSSVEPYVTWIVDAAGNAFWGHYFAKVTDASSDYAIRAQRGY